MTMKRTLVILSTLIVYFLSTATSCDDEPFVTIKPIESAIYNEISAYRQSNGLAGPFVQQFVMVQEAQIFSAIQSINTTGMDTVGIAERWEIIHDKIGGTNDMALLQRTTESSASAIVSAWTTDSTFSQMLLGDFSQCGVGVEYNASQEAFVTVMLMLVE